MPESPEQLYARVVAQVGEGGRLPLPPVVAWDVFPFEGDLRTKVLRPPVAEEEPRGGEGGRPCDCEQGLPAATIWHDDEWFVRSLDAPGGLPVVLLLQPRAHLDLDDLDEDQAAALGRWTWRLHRVVGALPHVGRVHTMKIGDGGSHLHQWFVARPARFEQLRGSLAQEWDDILPPVPEDVWRADLAHVARGLAAYAGRALV